METVEQWRPVVGIAGYEVSDLGRVRSLDRVVLRKTGVSARYSGVLLVAIRSGTNGYLGVFLSGKRVTVHRLVAKAFLPPDPLRKFVNHKDGVKTNNALSNLEWCTKSENALHYFSSTGRSSLYPRRPVVVGGNGYPSMMHAAQALGVSPGHIHSAIAKSHKVKGLVAQYA